MPPNITPLATGLTQAGEHIKQRLATARERQYAKEQQERANELWLKRLREQAETERKQAEMLHEYNLLKEKEATERRRMQEATDRMHNRAMEQIERDKLNLQREKFSHEKTAGPGGGKLATGLPSQINQIEQDMGAILRQYTNKVYKPYTDPATGMQTFAEVDVVDWQQVPEETVNRYNALNERKRELQNYYQQYYGFGALPPAEQRTPYTPPQVPAEEQKQPGFFEQGLKNYMSIPYKLGEKVFGKQPQAPPMGGTMTPQPQPQAAPQVPPGMTLTPLESPTEGVTTGVLPEGHPGRRVVSEYYAGKYGQPGSLEAYEAAEEELRRLGAIQ